MPHLVVEYSNNLSSKPDWGKLPELIRDAAVETGMFPLGGIRVRLYPTEEYSIADGHDENGFVAILIRLGTGRSVEAKQKAGQHIFDAVSNFFADEFNTGHFMLSLDMVENDPDVSIKKNTVHTRLKQEADTST